MSYWEEKLFSNVRFEPWKFWGLELPEAIMALDGAQIKPHGEEQWSGWEKWVQFSEMWVIFQFCLSSLSWIFCFCRGRHPDYHRLLEISLLGVGVWQLLKWGADTAIDHYRHLSELLQCSYLNSLLFCTFITANVKTCFLIHFVHFSITFWILWLFTCSIFVIFWDDYLKKFQMTSIILCFFLEQ